MVLIHSDYFEEAQQGFAWGYSLVSQALVEQVKVMILALAFDDKDLREGLNFKRQREEG